MGRELKHGPDSAAGGKGALPVAGTVVRRTNFEVDVGKEMRYLRRRTGALDHGRERDDYRAGVWDYIFFLTSMR